MNGTEIIAEARLNFGEASALTLTDIDFQRWVNTALRQLYSILPLAELEVLAKTSTVTLTNGRGPLPASLDHPLSVTIAAVPAQLVPLEVIQAIDVSPYSTPPGGVWATDGETLWVRNSLGMPAAAEITYIEPPATITNFALPVVLPKWHAALVLFVTAFAYAQEEDKGQAQHYRNEALALVNRTFTAPEQEALEQ